MDAYEMIMQIRHELGETVEAHWQDLALLRKLNMEQTRCAQEIALQTGDWVMTSGTVTFTSGEATLPSDCIKPVYLEDSDQNEVPFRDLRDMRYDYATAATSFDGAFYTAYLKGNTIVLSSDTVSGSWTLWYYARVKDLAFGAAGASSGASALHFEAANQPSLANDYYNDVEVNTYDASTGARKLSTTITDYVGSTLVATITGTPTAGDLYGTVSKLPDEATLLMMQRALVSALAKPSSAIDPKYFEYQLGALRDQERTWKAWLETRIPGSRSVRISRRDHG
jgi:hypothetical protein